MMVERRPLIGGMTSMIARYGNTLRRLSLLTSRHCCQRGSSLSFNMAFHGGVAQSSKLPDVGATSYVLKLLVGDPWWCSRAQLCLTKYVDPLCKLKLYD
jgi:hypothetical protein